MAESNGNDNGQSNAGVVTGLNSVTQTLQKGNTETASGLQNLTKGFAQNSKKQDDLNNKVDELNKNTKNKEKASDKDRNTQINWLQKLYGHFAWSKKFQERIAKQGKLAASAVIDFGKAKIASVQKFAGNMLDLLLKGLGLAVLWSLFKWLSENNWQETVDKVRGWVEDIGLAWDEVVATLDGIWILLTRLSGGFWVFKGVANLIKDWFAFRGPIGTLLKFMWGFSFKALFGIGGAIWSVLTWITGKFGINGRIFKLWEGTKALWNGSKWFGTNSALAEKIKWIKGLFGGDGKIMTYLKELKGGIAQKFTSWFSKEGALQSIFKWIGTFFGSADDGGKIMKAIQTIKGNKIVLAIGKFLGSIGTKMLKFFGPIGWLMAGYDAIMAFWDAFQAEEGSLWDKTVAGLSAGIQAIVDFFFFDLVQLAEDSIKWLIKKVMGLFGFDEKEVEGMDFMKFSITGFLKDMFGDYMKIFEGIFKMDPALMLEGLKGMFGKAADIVGWIFDIAIKPALNWLAGFLGITKEGEDLIGKEFSLSKWLKEKLLDPIFGFLENLMNFDMEAIGRQLMGDTMYDMFFGEAGNKDTKDDLRKLGMMTDNTVFDDELKIEEISKLIEGHEGANRQGIVGQLATLVTDESIDAQQRDQLKTLLNKHGASLNEGGFVPAGKTVPAVLHGPEIIKPVPDLKSAGALGGVGGQNVVAPTTIVNKSSGSTTMMMGSSSEDKSNWKYGMQGA